MEKVETLDGAKKQTRSFVSLIFNYHNLALEGAIILAVLYESSYSLNPFIIPILILSLSYGLTSYFVIGMIGAVVAFLQNGAYGLELLFIVTLLLLMILMPRPQKFKYHFLLPSLYTNIIVFTIYLSMNFSMTLLMSGILLISLCLILVLTVHEFGRAIEDSNYEVQSWVIGSLILFFLLLTFHYEYLFYSLGTIAFLSFFKLEKRISHRYTFILMYSICLSYVLKITNPQLIILMIPALLMGIIMKPLLIEEAYAVSYLIPSIFIAPYFYKNPNFYLVLSSVLLSFVLTPLIKMLQESLAHRKSVRLSYETKEMSGIKRNFKLYQNYLEVLEEGIQNRMSPLDKTYRFLYHSLCQNCSRAPTCQVVNLTKNYLASEMNEEARLEIRRDCLYPNKFYYRLNEARGVLKNEISYFSECEIRSGAFKEEVQTLLIPLRTNDSSKNYEDVLLANLRAANFNVVRIYQGTDLVISFPRALSITEQMILEELMSNQETPYYLMHIESDYLMKEEKYFFQKRENLTFEYQVYYRPIVYPGGDRYQMIEDGSFITIVISDGMGHNENSGSSAEYLLKFIDRSLRISDKLEDIISLANKVLKIKNEDEAYATLDLVSIDLSLRKMRVIKAGSYISYLFHSSSFERLDNIYAPLGIIDNLDITINESSLTSNDILIMITDGISFDEDKLSNLITKNFRKSLIDIKNLIGTELIETEPFIDDELLLIVRF